MTKAEGTPGNLAQDPLKRFDNEVLQLDFRRYIEFMGKEGFPILLKCVEERFGPEERAPMLEQMIRFGAYCALANTEEIAVGEGDWKGIIESISDGEARVVVVRGIFQGLAVACGEAPLFDESLCSNAFEILKGLYNDSKGPSMPMGWNEVGIALAKKLGITEAMAYCLASDFHEALNQSNRVSYLIRFPQN